MVDNSAPSDAVAANRTESGATASDSRLAIRAISNAPAVPDR
jgi:hypothetical protein